MPENVVLMRVYLANLLAQNIHRLDAGQCKEVIAMVERQLQSEKSADMPG